MQYSRSIKIIFNLALFVMGSFSQAHAAPTVTTGIAAAAARTIAIINPSQAKLGNPASHTGTAYSSSLQSANSEFANVLRISSTSTVNPTVMKLIPGDTNDSDRPIKVCFDLPSSSSTGTTYTVTYSHDGISTEIDSEFTLALKIMQNESYVLGSGDSGVADTGVCDDLSSVQTPSGSGEGQDLDYMTINSGDGAASLSADVYVAPYDYSANGHSRSIIAVLELVSAPDEAGYLPENNAASDLAAFLTTNIVSNPKITLRKN